jgi:pimeloyl-ACP methyl ester carboxylesterase
MEVQSQPCFLTPRRLQPQFPLFVFLPGMDGTGQLLRSQTAGLEAGFDVRCLAIPPDDLTDWAGLTARVVELIEAEMLESKERSIYLCGESFGGCLAMKVATHSPHLFKRIILVNPASSFNSRPWIGWGSQVSRWLPEFLYHTSSTVLMPLLAHLSKISPSDRQALFNTVQSVPQKTSIWRMSLLAQFQISEVQLRKITQPVLLIASATDRLLPSLSEVQRLEKVLIHAKAVVLPGSGHACLLESEVNLYEIMKAHDFLDLREEKV